MYVSDYAFAAAPSAWTTTSYNYSGNDASGNKITEENWMYMGLMEWTIARASSYSKLVASVFSSGFIGYPTVNMSPHAVRPVFYLKSNVIKIGGNGTKNSPYRLSEIID